jgi:hypothetical protein
MTIYSRKMKTTDWRKRSKKLGRGRCVFFKDRLKSSVFIVIYGVKCLYLLQEERNFFSKYFSSSTGSFPTML